MKFKNIQTQNGFLIYKMQIISSPLTSTPYLYHPIFLILI